jgi:hypothetical protein
MTQFAAQASSSTHEILNRKSESKRLFCAKL